MRISKKIKDLGGENALHDYLDPDPKHCLNLLISNKMGTEGLK
jgi:hypothetical protein